MKHCFKVDINDGLTVSAALEMRFGIPFFLVTFIILMTLFDEIEAKRHGIKLFGHHHHHHHDKKEKQYSTIVATVTETGYTITEIQTVVQQMAAPTNYVKKGACYCVN